MKRQAKAGLQRDTLLNQKFTQTRSQRLDVTASIEPWSDLKVDLTLFQDKTVNHSQSFKYVFDTLTNDFTFAHLNPVDAGSYSISYIPIRTIFKKDRQQRIFGNVSGLRGFQANYLGAFGGTKPNGNPNEPYYNPSDTSYNNQYTKGYGPKSQDVLIPAFLAAYTKADPNKVALNPFRAFPLPNWRISYNGFTKFKWAQRCLRT